MSKYYFDVCLNLDKSYNVDEIEQDLGFAPTEVYDWKKSKGKNADKSIICLTTKEQNNDNMDIIFTQFLKNKAKELQKFKEIKDRENGSIDIYLVLLDHENLPVIGLEPEAIEILKDLGASWYID